MRLTWIGHATVVMEFDGVRLLTDPLLLRHNGPLRRRFPLPSRHDWEDPDAVLLSHLHHDHAELRSLRLLGDIPVLTAPGNAAWLRRKGIGGGTGLPGEAWHDISGRASASGVRVRLVQADHPTRPMPHRPNHTNGHLAQGQSGTVWFAGDTGLYDEMSRLPSLAGAPIDVAIVPIGGWGVRLPIGHLGPHQAAQACARVGARYALPIHWGTLHTPLLGNLPRGWMDRPAQEFGSALVEHAPTCEVIELLPGESAVVAV